MAKNPLFPTFNDFLIYDEILQKYLISNFEKLSIEHQTLLKPLIQDSHLYLPTINEIVLEVFPFVQKQSPEVINRLIARQKRVNFLIDHAVKNKNGVKLVFDSLKEKDPFILQIAKSLIFDLNKFIYKYEIKNFWSNLIFINHDINELFVGQIDLIACSNHEWFLLTYKTGRTSYQQKYSAELFLQKKLIETNTNLKIKKLLIFTPRVDRIVQEATPLSNQEIWKLKQTIVKLKGGK